MVRPRRAHCDHDSTSWPAGPDGSGRYVEPFAPALCNLEANLRAGYIEAPAGRGGPPDGGRRRPGSRVIYRKCQFIIVRWHLRDSPWGRCFGQI